LSNSSRLHVSQRQQHQLDAQTSLSHDEEEATMLHQKEMNVYIYEVNRRCERED